MKPVWASIAFTLLFSRAVLAQDAAQTLSWDIDAALNSVQTFTQTVTLDGQVLPGVPICTAAGVTKSNCTLPTAPLTPGTHTLAIEVMLNGASAKTVFTGLDTSTVTLPNAKNVRFSIVLIVPLGAPTTPGPITPVPVGVQQAPFTDPLGSRWTLEDLNDVCDGKIVGGGGGSTALILASERVYAFVPPTWYRNESTATTRCALTWTPVGPQIPKH